MSALTRATGEAGPGPMPDPRRFVAGPRHLPRRKQAGFGDCSRGAALRASPDDVATQRQRQTGEAPRLPVSYDCAPNQPQAPTNEPPRLPASFDRAPNQPRAPTNEPPRSPAPFDCVLNRQRLPINEQQDWLAAPCPVPVQ